MLVNIENSWHSILENEFQKSYFKKLSAFVDDAYREKVCYPKKNQIFNAFNHCSFEDLKVVIIGQDPYHGENQANGLSFSVNDAIKIPPSLKNIFKELESDLGKPIPTHGSLKKWATQGVLLLNATLTVEAHKAGSHQNKGWETFTDSVIRTISNQRENVVFLLWGGFAQKKGKHIDKEKHFLIKSVHPSPLSSYRGWFGSKPFSKTNAYLKKLNLKEIDW
ncbi:MAG: uracil-DNA glycosylase [Flavobacteriaceae bacterium]